MEEWNRRRFISAAAIAAGSGVAGWNVFGSHGLLAQAPAGVPDEILNPVEVSGAEAQPVLGKLPGQKRMYVLPDNAGEYHRVGSQVMKRIARREDTGDVHELATFTGNTGAAMPRHAYLSSHAAVLVMRGEFEIEVGGDRWTMMRGDFANLPPGTAHGWTMKSDGAQLALFSMNHRVGSAFTAMGERQEGAQIPSNVSHEIPAAALVRAAAAGDFQLAPAAAPAPAGAAVRVTNKQLPVTPGAYVLADGGGERFGGNTFLARNANTTGQFLFIITEGGPGGGVGAHFHARHFENFFALDGETLGWAYGKAVPLRTGDYFQAPPRNLHGFRLNQDYNRFAAFLTPGIFESFFTRGGGGGRGRGDGAGRGGAAPAGRGGDEGRGRAGFAGGAAEMFRSLQMSGRGPDGYPLDVHPAKLPLPPQDPIWTKGAASGLADRAALLAHAQAICGVPISREITPELRRALLLKPRPEDFI